MLINKNALTIEVDPWIDLTKAKDLKVFPRNKEQRIDSQRSVRCNIQTIDRMSCVIADKLIEFIVLLVYKIIFIFYAALRISGSMAFATIRAMILLHPHYRRE